LSGEEKVLRGRGGVAEVKRKAGAQGFRNSTTWEKNTKKGKNNQNPHRRGKREQRRLKGRTIQAGLGRKAFLGGLAIGGSPMRTPAFGKGQSRGAGKPETHWGRDALV